MSFSKVRTYLRQQVKELVPNAYEHKDVFNSDNVPRTRMTKKEAFHIFYEVPSIVEGQTNVENSVSATITMFFKADRNVEDEYDESMDLCNNIMRNCCSVASLNAFRETDGYPIQSCFPTSITSEPFDTNDNSFKISISMDMLIIESIC